MSIVIHKNPKENAALQPFVEGLTYTEIASGKDAEHPVSCGIFTLTQDALSKFKYPCDEFALVLEGELLVEDLAKPREIISVQQGDLVHVTKGATVKWSSPSAGTCFWVAQVVISSQDIKQYIIQ